MRDSVNDAIRKGKDGIAWATAEIHKERYRYIDKEFRMLEDLYDKALPKFMKQEYGEKPRLKDTVIEAGMPEEVIEFKSRALKKTLRELKPATPDITEPIWYMPITDKIKQMFFSDPPAVGEVANLGKTTLRDIVEAGHNKHLGLYDMIKNEKGEIRIDGKKVKRGIERLLKTGLYTPEDIAPRPPC
jgi:hypothetical protein